MIVTLWLWLKNPKLNRKNRPPMLDVIDNWLYINNKAVQKIDSTKDKTSPGSNICDYIIYHYTASTTAKSAHNNYQNPDTNVSWHLTIDRDGNVYQLYDFRKITWHAGKSGWRKPNGTVIDGLNKFSIGIEMVNAGPLTIKIGQYQTWSGQVVPDVDVFFDKNGNPWQRYTPQQIAAAKAIGQTLARQYKCIDILGHEQISPGRKQDPGPAFAATLAEIRRLTYGR